MKTKVVFLVAGIALGFLLAHFASDTQRNDVAGPVTRVDSLATSNSSPQKQSDYEHLPLKQGGTIKAERKFEKPVVATPKQPEKIYGVRIEESTVRELEEEKEILRQHAFAELNDDGWQIHILESDQALLHTGLSDGDIITHESINKQLQMADRAVLVNRFVALLKYIER